MLAKGFARFGGSVMVESISREVVAMHAVFAGLGGYFGRKEWRTGRTTGEPIASR